MDFKRKGKIGQTLQIINVVPLLIFGFLSMMLCYNCFRSTMRQEIQLELSYVADSVEALMDTAYPGDYSLVGEEAYRLYKGDTDITQAYGLLDALKENTELDLTLFYKDTCVLTTIYNRLDGTRYVGIGATETAVHTVLEEDATLFSPNAVINGAKYFTYYIPLHNQDGSTVGMICVAKPNAQVEQAIQASLYPFLLFTLIAIIAICVCLTIYTRRLAQALLHIRNFLAAVSTGNLTTELAPIVADRTDELGEIGRFAVTMQSSLRSMIEQDALTGLANRRAADRRLKQIIQKAEAEKAPFCVAMGDIDYFKKVNDTYGHDAGDIVLSKVAGKLQEHMRSYGFAARWGGEEFLIIFDRSNVLEAHRVLEAIRSEIQVMECQFDETTINVTISLGLVPGNTSDFNALIRNADKNLYEAKQNGRNCIVWDKA